MAEGVACEWCGRAIFSITGHDGTVWLAVKGAERGYDPNHCDASDDGLHDPGEASPVKVPYDRAVLVEVLVYHYRKDHASCGCGWAELGRSHPEHVATVYEESVRAKAGT